MSASSTAALPYHEPSIATILIQSSLLLLLNLVNHVLDRFIYCGLLGQILLGVAWGTPGTKWLSGEVEDTIVQLGYVGLILIVYEGGLSTSFSSLKSHFALSVGVAITGITLPVAFSFSLLSLTAATPLQAFAAGAALCSTSLGTTFTLLTTSGLKATRLGTVLMSAAMLDDVVGLILLQVINNLGSSSSSLSVITIVRPIIVSFGLVVALLLVCRFLILPVTLWCQCLEWPAMSSRRLLSKIHWALLCHLVILYGLVSGAVYAGTSALLASYLAGGLISWWDSLSSQKDIPSHGFNSPGATALSNGLGQVRHEDSATRDLPHQGIDPAPKTCSNTEAKAGTTDVDALLHEKQQIISKNEASGARVHEKYLFPVVQRILKPFFFASIGFSIPITRMFSGAIIWRGLVYAILMAFAKLVTGLWLAPSSTRLSFPPLLSNAISQLWRSIQARRGLFPVMKYPLTCWKWTSRKEPASCSNKNNVRPGGPERPVEQAKGSEVQDESGKPLPQPPEETIGPSPGTTVHLSKHADVPQHRSLYPVTVVGAAMVARGEIGFFIASLAEGKGIFISSSEGAEAKGQSSMYLVVVWAISLCTLIGPITAGAIVKRVRRLQAEERNGAGSTDPLGIWGMK